MASYFQFLIPFFSHHQIGYGHSLSLQFKAHFPGGPRLAGTILDFIEARIMEVVVTTGVQKTICYQKRHWFAHPFDKGRQEQIQSIDDSHHSIDTWTNGKSSLQQFMERVDHVTDSIIHTFLSRLLLCQICIRGMSTKLP